MEIEFFTATCLNWHHLLRTDERKNIITESLRFLVHDNRIWLYGFVIMPNHIHLIWAKQDKWEDKNIKQMFLKYTAQQLKFHLIDINAVSELSQYASTQKDRDHHFWERRPWEARMPDRATIVQKLHYIHMNPINANLCLKEEDYVYSSCAYYYGLPSKWDFIMHYGDHC